MAYKCLECKYDCNTWCETFDDNCGDCERLSNTGHCRCLMHDINNCPDFVPKEEVVNDPV